MTTHAIRPCQFCGREVTSENPDCRTCRGCWYGGAEHERQPRLAALIPRLAAIPGVERASVTHTGGGCFGLEVKLADGRIAFGTVAFWDGGDWDVDAYLPEKDDDRWACGLYTAEAWENATGSHHGMMPLTDDEFVAYVAEVITCPKCDHPTRGHAPRCEVCTCTYFEEADPPHTPCKECGRDCNADHLTAGDLEPEED